LEDGGFQPVVRNCWIPSGLD